MDHVSPCWMSGSTMTLTHLPVSQLTLSFLLYSFFSVLCPVTVALSVAVPSVIGIWYQSSAFLLPFFYQLLSTCLVLIHYPFCFVL